MARHATWRGASALRRAQTGAALALACVAPACLVTNDVDYSRPNTPAVVKKNSPESLPLLVVQAQGSPAKLSAFGPLMQDAAINARVNKDVSRWARGGKDC